MRRALLCGTSEFRWLLTVLALVSLIDPWKIAASQELQSLLDRIASNKVDTSNSIQVDARISDVAGYALVVSIEPEATVRLVSDPGIRVTPLLSEGVIWNTAGSVEVRDTDHDYFDVAPTIRLPFTENAARTVRARVEYAYCIIDQQCLFGEQFVEVALDNWIE